MAKIFKIFKFGKLKYLLLVLFAALVSDIFVYEPYFALHTSDSVIYSKKWPKELENLKIAVISDFHAGALFYDKWRMRKVVELVNKEKPDLVLLLGDYFNRYFYNTSMDYEKFAEYLENTNINEMSYNIGNQLSSQFPQIKAMGLDKQLLDFLDAHQHPESGHWHKELNYYAVNGIMKISGVYNAAGRPIPNAMAAAKSAIFAITSDEQVNAVVDLWNTWIAVRAIVMNLRNAGDDASAAEIVKTLWDNAPAMIRKSREKIAPFQKEMGSFSYHRKHASPTSQGAPVTFGYQSEGDINATVISSYLLINSLFNALDIPNLKVPMFGENDRLRYIELLENKRKSK
jgi:hypothetical protein